MKKNIFTTVFLSLIACNLYAQNIKSNVVLGSAEEGTAIHAVANKTLPSDSTFAIRGINLATNGVGIGIQGQVLGGGIAIDGLSISGIAIQGFAHSGYGVLGYSRTGTGGYFSSGGGNALLTNGKVGINSNFTSLNAFEILDINGRTRIRHNIPINVTAGVWFNNSTNSLNSADGSFFGMKNDNEAGIWIGNAWRFWINNSGVASATGGISVGGGETIAKVLKKSIAIDLPNINSGGTYLAQISVTGVNVGDNVVFNPSQLLGSLTINYCTIATTDFITIFFTNNGSAYDAPAMSFNFTIFK